MPDWMLASRWGILRAGDVDASDAAWHAGRLFDALRVGPTPGGPLLVASDGSGVWIVNEGGGPAIPLSASWPAPGVWSSPTPNVACLVQGIHAPEHVYAGGSSLSETDTTQLAPLFHWRDIPIQGANSNPLNPGTINRILVIRELRKLVLACDNGIFWATIPSPGGAYTFTRETLLPGLRFSGLAEGVANAVVAGAWGTDLANHVGIFVGTWSTTSGPLTWTRATILGINPRMMRRVDLASYQRDRHILYAVCGGGNNVTQQINAAGKPVLDAFGNATWVNDDDFILAVLKSDNGGLKWQPTGTLVTGESLPLFPGSPGSDLAGHTQDGYVGCIGVSPFDANHVAVGIVEPFLSQDGGTHWTRYTEFTSAHRHEDTHALVFDPTVAGTLHICSDGGLATTPDLGKTWQSTANRQLPNLEFYRFGASPTDSGVIAGSLQDNGDIFAPLYITTDPWTLLEGGDGVMSQFLTGGQLLRQNNTIAQTDGSGTTVEYGRKVRAARWDAGERTFHDLALFPDPPLSYGVVPVDGTGDGLAVPPNQEGQELVEPVATPTFANAAGEPMVAVGVSALAVFGMFAVPDGTLHWQPIGTVPSLPNVDKFGNPLPYFATAVAAAPDGTAVFVGMNTGKIFRLDLAISGTPIFDLSDPAITVQVTEFVAFAPDQVFVIAGSSVFRGTATGWTPLPGKVLPGGVSATLPGQPLNTLAGDPTTTPPTLYVATSSQVFQSQDSGDTWFDFTANLPKAAGCNDLRWVQETSGVTFLYLATFGWSVFRRPLNFEAVLEPVTVDGHMDLIDRVLIGTDDIVHPTFADSRMLGPLHPFEQMGFIEDDTGGEVRAVLKLDFAWKTDGSVVMTVSADLIDLEDDEVDAHADTTVTIPFGAAESVVIDLKSGEIEPDRAHIEFTVTNG